MNIETCFICDEPTGRAGKGDDSIYAENGDGPFCVACWKKLQSNKQPDPTTPTVPGWYWVKTPTDCYPRYVGHDQITQNRYGFYSFAECKFAPCTGKPEGWGE